MKEQQHIRVALDSMGVKSVGFYTCKGVTCIVLHCDSEEVRNDAKNMLLSYFPLEKFNII